MLRICTAAVAVTLVAALSMPAASAKELKPKFGDIGGVYYSDVAGNREACRQAIRNKIALCRQNTNFESNTKNRKYKGCLPIFRRQAQSCVVHFRHQMSKCNLSGAARITDFTGFGCEATKTVVEEGGGPDIAPLDRRMAARTRVNLRAGPGTNHRVVGSLAAGQAVQATGRAGDWLRIARPGGGTAFVHGSFMVASAGKAPPKRAGGGMRPKSDTEMARLRAKWARALSRCWDAESEPSRILFERNKCWTKSPAPQHRRACDARYEPQVTAALRKADISCCRPVRRSSARDRTAMNISSFRKLCKAVNSYRKYGWSW